MSQGSSVYRKLEATAPRRLDPHSFHRDAASGKANSNFAPSSDSPQPGLKGIVTTMTDTDQKKLRAQPLVSDRADLVERMHLLLEGGGVQFADFEKGDDPEMASALLRLFILAIPFLLAFLFAPYLTGWDGVPPAKSLFFSFVASLRNWRARL